MMSRDVRRGTCEPTGSRRCCVRSIRWYRPTVRVGGGQPSKCRPGSDQAWAKVRSYDDTPRGAIGAQLVTALGRRRAPHEWNPSSTTEIGKRGSRLVASDRIAPKSTQNVSWCAADRVMRKPGYFYLVPSKLALCVLQSAGGGAITLSLLLIDPKPGIELKRFNFLRSFVDVVGCVAAEAKVCACVGDGLALS